MDDTQEFFEESRSRIASYPADSELTNSARKFMKHTIDARYSYNFTWMGLPIIQYPQDIMAMQELIFKIKPDCIIETGIARGGSLIFYSSMLELLGNRGKVIGIDVDIREHNRRRIMEHPLYRNIEMLEGSSVSPELFNEVKMKTSASECIMVVLDSNHTHEHVLAELELYSGLVSLNSYCVVFDTIIEDLPAGTYDDRPWDIGNNPKTAVKEFLRKNQNFVTDPAIDNKLLLSVAPEGYLKRIK